jgi:DnaJ-domain-containing protein 1
LVVLFKLDAYMKFSSSLVLTAVAAAAAAAATPAAQASAASSSPPSDLYAVLNVDKSASTSQIKKAFRKQSLQHHPDKVILIYLLHPASEAARRR